MMLATDHPEAAARPVTFRELGQSIVQQSLPAFGLTLHEVFMATDGNSLSGHQVAEIILRDPALTSRVLRAANAAHLGHSSTAKVVTVSRAVVVLGNDAIRSLCVSAMTVESMDTATQFRHRVQGALGRALHAAVQARDMGICQGSRKEDAERLFVEALLSSIGEMAFWCYGDVYAERLDQALESGMVAAEAEQSVLGTSLRQFSRDLLQAWNLGAVMQSSREVTLAERLSRAAQHGWQAPDACEATQAIGALLGQPSAETLQRLQRNARQARTLATALGAGEAAGSIPVASPAAPELAEAELPVDCAAGASPVYPEPNLQLQLRMLTEMAKVATSRKDLPMVLEACLEGLHRAVGLDRCVLCLWTPARDRLVARMATGVDVAELRARLQMDWTRPMEEALQPGRTSWFTADAPPMPFLRQASGVADCFAATLTVDNKTIGMFYADCQPSKRPLSDDGFESFRSFVMQAEIVARVLPR